MACPPFLWANHLSVPPSFNHLPVITTPHTLSCQPVGKTLSRAKRSRRQDRDHTPLLYGASSTSSGCGVTLQPSSPRLEARLWRRRPGLTCFRGWLKVCHFWSVKGGKVLSQDPVSLSFHPGIVSPSSSTSRLEGYTEKKGKEPMPPNTETCLNLWWIVGCSCCEKKWRFSPHHYLQFASFEALWRDNGQWAACKQNGSRQCRSLLFCPC